MSLLQKESYVTSLKQKVDEESDVETGDEQSDVDNGEGDEEGDGDGAGDAGDVDQEQKVRTF